MKSTYKGHRFPPEIISHAIWLYHRFTLSFRDVFMTKPERLLFVIVFIEVAVDLDRIREQKMAA